MTDAATQCSSCGSLNPTESRFCARCGAEMGSEDGDAGLRAGDVVGDGVYRIVRRLGMGGMGTVYEAVEQRLERPVALKFLHPEFLAHPTAAKRFEREGRAMASIDHPNVVRIHTQFDHEGSIVLVLQLVTGGDLTAKIEQGLSWQQARDLMVGLLRGLEAIHGKGLVHRDLKPDNVLIDPVDGTPRITDLGIAHDSEEAKGMTRAGARLGTAEYMSPEQIRGLGVDARTDLYAAGIILFEMLSGDPPFRGTTDFDVWQAHSTQPPPLERLRGRASDGAIAWIERALSKSSDGRWDSAASAREDLVAVGDGGAASKPEARPVIRKPEPAPRRSVESPASGVSAVPPAIPRKKRSIPIALGVALLVGLGVASVIGEKGETSEPRVTSSVSSAKKVALRAAAPRKEETCGGVPVSRMGELAGTWKLVTVVTAGKGKNIIGTNGFYNLTLSPASEGCRLGVTLHKVGYGKGRPKKKQNMTGVGSATPIRLGEGFVGWRFESVLTNAKKTTLPMEVYFRYDLLAAEDAERVPIEGLWHYDHKAFKKNRFYGVLRAARSGWPHVSSINDVRSVVSQVHWACSIKDTGGWDMAFHCD